MSDPIEELKEDFKSATEKITDSVNGLSGEISGMKSTMVGVEKILDRHEDDIKETRGKQVETATKISVLNRAMFNTKGNQTAPVAFEDKTNGAIIKKLFSRYGHWMIIALLAIGFYFGSGGDEEKTLQVLRNLREIGIKVEKIEKIKTEPIRVPVPVSEECVSEDIPQ